MNKTYTLKEIVDVMLVACAVNADHVDDLIQDLTAEVNANLVTLIVLGLGADVTKKEVKDLFSLDGIENRELIESRMNIFGGGNNGEN